MSWDDAGQSYVVASFKCPRDATAFIENLRGDLGLDTQEPQSLEDFYAHEGLGRRHPQSLPEHIVAIGRNVLGWTLETHCNDPFPSFRALAWKRGGQVIANGVVERWPVSLATALRVDARSVDVAELSSTAAQLGELSVRGDVFFAVCDPRRAGLTGLAEGWHALARRVQGTLAAELVSVPGRGASPIEEALANVTGPALRPPTIGWLVARVDSSDMPGELDDVIAPGSYECCAGTAIIRRDRVSSEDGFEVCSFGSLVTLIEGDTLVLEVRYRPKSPERGPPPTVERLRMDLEAHLGPHAVIEPPLDVDDSPLPVRTESPLTALRELSRFANLHHLDAWVTARSPQPLAAAIRRLAVEVGSPARPGG